MRQVEDMDSSRNFVLAILGIAIALAIFYMIDPSMGGLMGRRREGFANKQREQFVNSQEHAMNDKMVDDNVGGTYKASMLENGPLSANQVAAHGSGDKTSTEPSGAPAGKENKKATGAEGFADYEPSPMPFPEADKPANCYPKNQLSPQELLPADPNSKWAQVNPMGAGDISGKNFLNAGSLIGVNTVGQSLRNANQQLRSEPPNPQMQVSIWNQSTIEPDLARRPLEGF